MKNYIGATALAMIFLFNVTTNCQTDKRDQGIDLYREGKYSAAAALLQEAATANPKDRQAWLFLAGAYIHTGEEQLARQAFTNSRVIQKEGLPKYDTPLKILQKPQPESPHDRTGPFSVNVSVIVEFLASGKIGFIRVLESGTQEFGEASVNAAKKIRFKPAVMAGKPVTVIGMLEYSFEAL